MNKNHRIDEMIKADKTISEIQAELRKVVAARDEATLKAQKINKVKEARAAAVKALVNYCLTLGVPMKDEELTSSLDSALASYEKELAPWLKILEKVPAEPKSRSTLDDVSLEDALAQLRAFADAL